MKTYLAVVWWLYLATTAAGTCPSSSLYDRSGGKGCDKEWELAVETSKTGTVVQGSKSRLADAVKRGARVRVFVGAVGDGYSAEADNMHVMPTNNEVCAQLLQSVSIKGWAKFADNAYWWWVYICTSGHVHMTRYNVGSSTFRGESKSTVSAKWFVKFPGPQDVAFYKNNASGERTDGALFPLVHAIVENGADVRGVSGGTYSFALQNLDTTYTPFPGNVVSGQSLNHVSMTSSGNVASFQGNAYWWFTILSSDGTRDMSRWTVGEHIDRGHTSDTTSCNWYADRCWKLVYTSGENGEGLYGAREDLVSEIKQGKRVRVLTQGSDGHSYVTDADAIWVRNGHVTVQNLGQVSKADAKHFQDNVYWFWQMKSTTGTVVDTRYNVGENKARGTTTKKSKINWYVEARPMKMALSHESDGSVTGGSHDELTTAIKAGASVQVVTQLSQNAISSYPAHNLKLKSTSVAAQNVKQVSVKEKSGSRFEYEIQPNPYWWFSIVTTEGKRDMIRYTVGTSEARGHNQDTVALKWFVNV